jgi:hypothetical protein
MSKSCEISIDAAVNGLVPGPNCGMRRRTAPNVDQLLRLRRRSLCRDFAVICFFKASCKFSKEVFDERLVTARRASMTILAQRQVPGMHMVGRLMYADIVITSGKPVAWAILIFRGKAPRSRGRRATSNRAQAGLLKYMACEVTKSVTCVDCSASICDQLSMTYNDMGCARP